MSELGESTTLKREELPIHQNPIEEGVKTDNCTHRTSLAFLCHKSVENPEKPGNWACVLYGIMWSDPYQLTQISLGFMR